jgi:tRNA U34 5-carboxymethylaminomethyl modifying GTPase MnmE/TrmE
LGLAPHSYTTQNTVELHIHSGRALVSALLASLSCLPGLRPAEAGEFTRQAVLGGRLDLTQVEGLHDLIEAGTEVQRVWALTSALVGFCHEFWCFFSPQWFTFFVRVRVDRNMMRFADGLYTA